MRNEKLAAAGVFARQSHPDRAADVRPGVNLAADLITGATFAIAARIATLNDEIRHDPVEGQVIEEAFARERDEAIHSDRRVLWEEFDPDLAFRGVNRGRDLFVNARDDALIKGVAVARLNDADAVGEIARAHLFEQIDGMSADQVVPVGERGFDRFDRLGLIML